MVWKKQGCPGRSWYHALWPAWMRWVGPAPGGRGQDIVGGVCISGWELASLDEAYQTLQDLLCAVKLPGAREQHVLFIL